MCRLAAGVAFSDCRLSTGSPDCGVSLGTISGCFWDSLRCSRTIQQKKLYVVARISVEYG